MSALPSFFRFMAVPCLLLPGACAQSPAPVDAPTQVSRIERHLGAMGTSLEVVVEAKDRATALAASEAGVLAIEAAEARLSTWEHAPSSELARLNRSPLGMPMALGPDLVRELTRAKAIWNMTGGAFDPGVGGLVQAWGLRNGGRQPSPTEITSGLAAGGCAALDLQDARATRTHAGLVLEEGGFGKGAGLDAGIMAARAAGATRAILDLGGQVAVLGAGPFRFDIADPINRERPAVQVTIDGGSLATTGNSERGIVVNGTTLSHVLDPRTGQPAEDFGSLTIWASGLAGTDGLTADALSTGLYVLGSDAALAWAEAYDGPGRIEVLALERRDQHTPLVVRATGGMVFSLLPRNSDLKPTAHAATDSQ